MTVGLSERLMQLESGLGFKNELKWRSIFFMSFLHFFGFYWCYKYAFPAKWQSMVFAFVMFIISGLGITCGVHRLFTHRSYKVKLPLKIYLMLSFASSGQNSVHDWVRDHRLHHKQSDTDADPHNVNRGFFFSHIGWLMMKKNNMVLEKGRQIDMSDITSDPVLMFNHRHSTLLSFIFCYTLPTLTGMVLWGETWRCAVAWQCFIRVLMVLHSEMTINSLAHLYGYKPYNITIMPAQNRFAAFVTLGEGWHNYHHVFPYDYKAAEFPDVFNLATYCINTWARMGLAYDLKVASPQLVQAVVRRQNEDNLKMEDDYNTVICDQNDKIKGR